MKRTLTALAALSLAACTQIDTGNVGVDHTFGQIKKEVLQPDIYFTLFKRVTEVIAKEVPLQLNDLRPQTADKITLQDLDVDIYVQIDPGRAPEIMGKWPGDLTAVDKSGEFALGLNYVSRQAREAVYTVVAKHNSATVHTERAALASALVKTLQKDLDESAGKGMFFVRSANVRNLVTDLALEANIKAAANAQFQLQAEENQLKVVRVQAERMREAAKGEADAIRIKAEAVAKQGGAEYVQLQAIAKWNGVLPTTQAAGAVPFINVK